MTSVFRQIALTLYCGILLTVLPFHALAQTPQGGAQLASAYFDAPEPQASSATIPQPAALSATVVDTDGEVVPGATVSLRGPAPQDLRTAIAGGAKVDDAADFLCRTPDEVAIRAATLGLRWHEFFH